MEESHSGFQRSRNDGRWRNTPLEDVDVGVDVDVTVFGTMESSKDASKSKSRSKPAGANK